MEFVMEAKHLKKISQAYHGVKMGNLLKAVVDAGVNGETTVNVSKEDMTEAMNKYFTDLGYKLEESGDSVVISW
jgi:vacuolar-type H+-ATPase subunit E/Vma4